MYCPYCAKPFPQQMQWTRHVMGCKDRAPTDPSPSELFGLGLSGAHPPVVDPDPAPAKRDRATPVMDLEFDEGEDASAPTLDLDTAAVGSNDGAMDVHAAAATSGERGWLDAPTDDGEELSLELATPAAGDAPPDFMTGMTGREPHAEEFRSLSEIVRQQPDAKLREQMAAVMTVLQRLAREAYSRAPKTPDADAATTAALNMGKYLALATQGHQEMVAFLQRQPRARVEGRLKELGSERFPDPNVMAIWQKKRAECLEAERRITVAQSVVATGLQTLMMADERLGLMLNQGSDPEIVHRLATLARQAEAAVCASPRR